MLEVKDQEKIQQEAEKLMKVKEYKIGEKIFVNTQCFLQTELINEILESLSSEDTSVNAEMEDEVLGFKMMALLNQMSKKKQVAKLFSYYLVEKDKKFSMESAEENEAYFKINIDVKTEAPAIFRDFFIGDVVLRQFISGKLTK